MQLYCMWYYMHVFVALLNFAGAIDLEKPMTVHITCTGTCSYSVLGSPKCLNSASVVILSANERGHQRTLYICINRNYSVIYITTQATGRACVIRMLFVNIWRTKETENQLNIILHQLQICDRYVSQIYITPMPDRQYQF